MRRFKRTVFVTRNRHECAIRLPAFELVFVNPHLRYHVIDVRIDSTTARVPWIGLPRCPENLCFGHHMQVPIHFVVDIEVRATLSDRMIVVHVIKRDVAFEPFGFSVFPRTADDRFEPRGVGAANRVVDANDAAAAFKKLFEVFAIGPGD